MYQGYFGPALPFLYNHSRWRTSLDYIGGLRLLWVDVSFRREYSRGEVVDKSGSQKYREFQAVTTPINTCTHKSSSYTFRSITPWTLTVSQVALVMLGYAVGLIFRDHFGSCNSLRTRVGPAPVSSISISIIILFTIILTLNDTL